jgi:hypothetical protein
VQGASGNVSRSKRQPGIAQILRQSHRVHERFLGEPVEIQGTPMTEMERHRGFPTQIKTPLGHKGRKAPKHPMLYRTQDFWMDVHRCTL